MVAVDKAIDHTKTNRNGKLTLIHLQDHHWQGMEETKGINVANLQGVEGCPDWRRRLPAHARHVLEVSERRIRDVIRPVRCRGDCRGVISPALTGRQPLPPSSLSRQNLEQMSGVDVNVRREGTLKGAYVTKPEVWELKKIVMGMASEVQHLMAAFKDDAGVRVVSMPCMERFDRLGLHI